MATILLVDDEAGYRETLTLGLTGQGYTTRTVASGMEAISVGARLRPQVVIADWLLLNHIHGLHVIHALRVVDPQLRSIVITGFDADDLRYEATQVPGCAYLAKPFRRHTLLQEVRRALEPVPLPPDPSPVAVVEINATGEILYTNPAAHDLLGITIAGGAADTLLDVLDLPSTTLQDLPPGQWHAVQARTSQTAHGQWWLGLRSDPGMTTRLAVLARQDDEYPFYDTATRFLLNLPSPAVQRWPWDGPALIVDADWQSRQFAQSQLEGLGAICHTAHTPLEALRLWQRNPAIRVVILAEEERPRYRQAFLELVQQLRLRQPPALLVGTSVQDRRDAFVALGIATFVRKPWHAAALLAALHVAPAAMPPQTLHPHP